MGGEGKTTWWHHFVQALKTAGWLGARRVFAWSFSSQGSGADEFFAAAIRFFGDDPTVVPKDSREKGLLLAELVQARRSLLVLDGLETLQKTRIGAKNTTSPSAPGSRIRDSERSWKSWPRPTQVCAW